MPFVAYVPKEPGEKIPLEINYKTILRVGETVSSAIITSKDRADGSDATSTMIIDPYSLDSTNRIVTQEVEAGTDGHTYIVKFKVTTSEGEEYEGEFIVPVEEFI